MSRFGAVLDSCVLVPIGLANTLLTIAETELFQPLWSQTILDETLRTLKTIHPKHDPSSFESRIQSMCDAFPEACVYEWEYLEQGLKQMLPDPGDAHVVATAIQGRAEVIVTNNLKDFPIGLMQPIGLQAISPDSFLLDLLDMNPLLVLESVRRQASRTSRPILDPKDLLASISNQVPNFAVAADQKLKR